jgi:predicted Fe-Mo cluster-binding NifX family protein
MKIAIPTKNKNIDANYSLCKSYTIFSVEGQKIVDETLLTVPEDCSCKPKIAVKFLEMGVSVLLVDKISEGDFDMLRFHTIEVIRGCKGIALEVVKLYLKDELIDNAELL